MTNQPPDDCIDGHLEKEKRNGSSPNELLLRDKLLLEEFKEAWLHYRHIEQMRIRHLAFFFTVSLAGTGVVAALADTGEPTQLQLWAAALFTFVLIVIGLFVRGSIRRWDPPMSHYEKVFTRIRQEVYGNEFEKFNALLNLRKDEVVKKASPKGVIHLGAERVVEIILAIAMLVEAWLLFQLCFSP